jgi:hypothetical protein
MVGHVNKIMWVRMRWSNDPPKCAFVLYGEGYGTAVVGNGRFCLMVLFKLLVKLRYLLFF